MRLAGLLVALMLSIVLACATLTPPMPPTGPGTDYPCGINGISCGNGMCCWRHEECGHSGAWATCPPGMCCNLGNVGARRKQHDFDGGGR
jgi:hypothetical protein